MKKLITVLIVLLFAASAIALEFGDPMPEVSAFQVQSIRPWFWGSRRGIYIVRDNNPEDSDDLSEYAIAVYLVCDGAQLPLPYGILFNSVLHLDVDYNGIIDSALATLPAGIGMLSPECPPPTVKL